MGSSVSKQDRNTALLLCKDRLRHIEQAIDSRYALSAAQLSYEQSLRNVGIALRLFAESHHDGDPEKSPRSSYASLSALPTADNANFPALPEPHHSDVSHMRSAVITPLTVTVDPSDASFVKKEQTNSTFFSPPPPPEFCSSWDFFDPTDVIQNVASHVPGNSVRLRRLEDLGHPNVMDLTSSIENTSEIVEVQEELSTPGWKEVHENDNHPELNHNDCNKIQIADMHLPNDSSLEKEPDQVQMQVIEGQNYKPISSNRKKEVYYVDKVIVPKRSCSEREEDMSSSFTSVSKDFLSSVNELEHQFTRAAESCNEVSRMLEARKIRLSISSGITGKSFDVLFLSASLICCKAGSVASHESEQLVTKVITWNRSLSSRSSSSKNPLISAQKDYDPPERCSDFVEEFCMISGSHASSLDRLYAWERKLYDELKASESLKKIYDKKCTQLRHQFAKDLNARQVDKTRATVKDLYSRLMVGTEVLYSISKMIEKLRDEELQPQLLELLQGLTRMWRMMQEIHQMQLIIVSQADTKFSSVSPPRESYKQSLMNLISEMGFLYSSLASWVGAYKCYVGGLNSWLQKCVVQPQDRSRGRRLILLPRQHLAPPLFVLLGDWSTGISLLPSEESCDSIKNLAAGLKKMCKHQAEDKPAKKKSSDTAEANTGQSIGEHDKTEAESKMATLQSGLITMFDRLSKFSSAMASLSENVKQGTEVAREAYTIGRSG